MDIADVKLLGMKEVNKKGYPCHDRAFIRYHITGCQQHLISWIADRNLALQGTVNLSERCGQRPWTHIVMDPLTHFPIPSLATMSMPSLSFLLAMAAIIALLPDQLHQSRSGLVIYPIAIISLRPLYPTEPLALHDSMNLFSSLDLDTSLDISTAHSHQQARGSIQTHNSNSQAILTYAHFQQCIRQPQ